VRRMGFEANLHDLNHDGFLFHSKAEFLRRAALINQYARQFECRGFRSGSMYREQEWFDAFDFSFDMSVPSVAHLEPQRGGCCTVMPYFIGRILELPLTTIQDYSLFHILGDYSIRIWADQIRRILERHGLISFITHPDYLAEPGARSVYRNLLNHLSDLRKAHHIWFAPPGGVNDWWRDRQHMVLVREGCSWRITGHGSSRARVAWAALDGERVVYEVEGAPVAHCA
jgi:hypothetical protein